MTRTTRVIGHMVTRNEHDRYLTATIPHLNSMCDTIHVYDDGSTDGTYEYLREQHVFVTQRSARNVPFSVDESVFRSTAWSDLALVTLPSASDWILCIDADEFLVSPTGANVRHALTDLIETATETSHTAVTFPVHEVFGFDTDNTPLVRVDGYWGSIQATRFARWRPNGVFAQRTEGGGSLPTAWQHNTHHTTTLAIMHLGYARETDRHTKHDRYTHTTGHNPHHVASILETPTLTRWQRGPDWP